MKPGGQLALGYIGKNFGKKSPFTQSGFSFYENEEVEKHLKETGFLAIWTTAYSEEATAKDGTKITRPYFITQGKK